MSAPDKHRAGFIAICGRTNAGKSTLLNRLVGQKIAAVSARPQTTRTRIIGIRSDPGAQFVFIDMPGVNYKSHLINSRMSATARRATEEGEVILAIVAARGRLDPDDRKLLEELTSRARPIVIAINKVDLGPRERVLPLIKELSEGFPNAEIVPMSALTGENIEALLSALRRALPESPSLMPEDEVTDQTERMLAAEMVREKVFDAMRQEVPFSTAVVIRSFETDVEKSIKRIHADIIVEREAHKGMIIGAHAATLKKIGIAARVELESMLASRIHLALNVRVDPNWTRDAAKFAEYGL